MENDSLLATAKDRAQKAKSAWSEIFEQARSDLEFLSDAPDAQWDGNIYADRVATGRPVVSLDQLSQFVNQTVNDIRMNTPSIKCIPGEDNADVETAEVLDGWVKNIEYESGADTVYDTAAAFAVKSSIGFIRVDHDYADQKGFDQKLCIKRVINPASILIDPFSIEIDGSDAQWGFVFDTMRVADFKREHPDKEPCSFWDDSNGSIKVTDEDVITIAEYFYIEEEKQTVTPDEYGKPSVVEEVPEGAKARKITKKKIKRCKLTGKDELESSEFPGEYIPLIPVYGQEAWENGKRKLQSLIRKGKSGQSMFNLWKSLETEVLMKQPMAPVMAANGQTENFAADWLNPSKVGVLRYEVKDANGNTLPPPQRLMPPSVPVGFAQASRASIDDIKGSLGMYNASLGQKSNETSGVAIAQRKQEGDVATYHFGDNLVKSITHVGRILLSARKTIYDTPRLIRTIDAEDNPKVIGINGRKAEGQERDYDFANGDYSVRVVTGPSFTTQRQEAAAFYSEIATRFPQLMQFAGDLVFQYSDAPGAQAIAKRLKKTIPPQLLEGEDGEEEQDPEKMQMKALIEQGNQAIVGLQQEMQTMKQQLDNKQGELMIKAKTEENDTAVDIAKLELEKQKLQIEAEKTAATIALKDRELKLREEEMAMRMFELRSQASRTPEGEESAA